MITTNFDYDKLTFSAGEMHIKILDTKLMYSIGEIEWKFESTEEVFEILLLANTFKSLFPSKKLFLVCRYFPFARQDRHTTRNQPFSLKVFCDLLNTSKIDTIFVDDLHSNASLELLEIPVIERTQDECFFNYVSYNYVDVDQYTYFVAPDKGAVDKTEKSAKHFGKKYALIDKERNPLTGEITNMGLSAQGYIPVEGVKHKFLILDDCLDGGFTFVKAAELLKQKYDCTVDLYVTHGIFSKGTEVFNNIIDNIYVFNDMRKEQTK